MHPNRLVLQRAWRSMIAIVMALGLLVPATASTDVKAQERMPLTAAAVPEDAVLYFELDLDFDGPQWQQTEELLARVGVPDALDLWREEMLSEGADSGEFSQADLDALLGGEVAFVVTPAAVAKMLAAHAAMGTHDHGAMDEDEMAGATPTAGGDDEPLGIAAILRPGDPAASWDYAVRQVNSFAEKSGIELMVASGPGQDIIWAERMPEGEKEDWGDDPFEDAFGHHEEKGFAIGHAGDFIIAAENPADVTSILEVIDGTTSSLADSEAAQDVAARMPQDALSFTYVNAKGVIDSLDPDMLESLESLMPANMPPEALGGYGAITVSADSDGFRFDSVSIPAEGVDISAYTVQNDPEVSRAAEQAPAGTFIFSAGNLPPNAFAGAALGLSQMVNGATTGEWPEEDAMAPLPSPEEIDEQIAQATETLGFNPQTDLFDLLGGEYIAFSSLPILSFEGFGLDAAAAVSTSDPDALAETMQKIGAWGDRLGDEADVSVRKVGSDSIYVVSDPSAPEAPALQFGVLGDRAVIAVGMGLEQLSSAPEDSLAEDAQYQAVMGLLPAEFYQVSYVDVSMALTPIMMLTGEFENTEITDADVACAVYDTQELAQAAYDEDPVTNIDLDQDFDGMACEDAFETTASTPVSASGSLMNVRALAMVAYQDDTVSGASGILYIAEPGS